ncbi:MAG: hypothetical protein EOP83_29405 [Verrucomicrobiaceae bacterium]|nr:MAG: hypothetical protein EOP83_29405 [Verrucomicrobiaceae bacterium]
MAKSRSIGGIYAELSLRDGKFKAGMKAASVAIGRFAKASAKYSAIGGGLATAAGTAALARGTLKTLDQVDALGDLSAQTGVAVADMMKLQRAYADGGRAADAAGKDIGKMQKTIYTAASGGKDPFASIGLNAAELLKLREALPHCCVEHRPLQAVQDRIPLRVDLWLLPSNEILQLRVYWKSIARRY